MFKYKTARYYLFKARITNRNKFKIQGINKIFNKIVKMNYLVEKLKGIKILKKMFYTFTKILYNSVPQSNISSGAQLLSKTSEQEK